MGSLLEIGLANAVVAVALALLAVLAGRLSKRPALVHVLWLLVLVKLVTPPLFTFPVPWWRQVEEPKQPETVAVVAPAPRVEAPPPAPPVIVQPMPRAEDVVLDKIGMPLVLPNLQPPVVAAAPPIQRASEPAAVAPTEPEPVQVAEPVRVEDRWSGVVQLAAVVWIGGAVLWLILTAVRVARFQRLLHHAKLAPQALQDEAERIAKHLGLGRAPQIWLIPGPVPPLLWAIGSRARLFFPQTLLPRLEDPERATLLAHELAHLARRDHWVRLLELLVAALYWWYPLVWLACRRLQAAEEECCDAWVVHAMPAYGTAYAGALVETVDFLAEQPQAAFPPAASGLGRVDHLKKRLAMIVRGTTPRGLSGVGKILVLVLVASLPLTPGPARAVGEQDDESEPDPNPVAVTPVVKAQSAPVGTRVAAVTEEPDRYSNNPRVLLGRAGQVWQAAISPDGKSLAVVTGGNGDNEGALTLFDLATGEERASVSEPKPIRCVAYSPDGNWLATGDFARMAQLRDPKTGEVRRVLEGHTEYVNAIAFLPDSRTVVTGSRDKTIKLWDVATGRVTKTLTGHTQSVLSLAVSRDGKTLVSACNDRTARVWDLPSGKLRHELRGHAHVVEGIAISPDNSTVATTGLDNLVKLWDAATGNHLLDLVGHTSNVNAAAFLPDGKMLATASHDRTVRFWDVATGALASTLETRQQDVLFALAVSPDGKTFVTGSFDFSTKVWDAETREVRHTLMAKRYRPENNYPLLSLAVSPDGKTLAVSGEERAIKLLDAGTGELRHLLEGHEDVVPKVVFAPDGKTLASASFDGTIRLWDVASGKWLRTLTGHENWVFTVAFSPDGTTLVSGGYDKTVRLWDARTGSLLHTLDRHKGGVRAVAFSSDGKTFASGGADRTVRVWDLATRQTIQTMKGHDEAVRAIAISPNGERVYSGAEDSTVRLWNVADGKQLAARTFQPQMQVYDIALSPMGRNVLAVGPTNARQAQLWELLDAGTLALKWGTTVGTGPYTCVGFSPDARQLYAGSADRSIRVWQGQMAPRPALVSYPSVGSPRFVAHSPDGKWLAMGGEDKTLQVRDVRFAKLLSSLALEDAPAAVFGMAVSPDGTKLAAACFDKSVRVWDLKTRKLLSTYDGFKDRAWTVAFSPDGKRLVAAAGSLGTQEEPGEVKVWEIDSKKEPMDLQGVDASCMCVNWSPDGKWLAVGTRDGLAKLYDAATGEVKHVLKGHKEGTTVRYACFSPDSKHVATACTDATVRVWRTDSGQQVAHLEGHKSGVNCIDWSSDGKHLAGVAWPASQPDPEVRLWAVEEKDGQLTFKEKAKLKGHKAHVLACAFSPDGKLLATGGGIYAEYGETIVWDVESGKPMATLHGHSRWIEGLVFARDGKKLITGGGNHDTPGEVRFWNVGDRGGWSMQETTYCAAWSQDGKMLATGGDRSVKTWDAATGKLLAEFKDAHRKPLRSLTFSPDGKALASGSEDETVKLWDVEAKKEIAELTRHPMPVTSLAFSKDGKLLATASGHTQKAGLDGDVRVIEVDTGKERQPADWSDKGATSVAFSPDGKHLLTGAMWSNGLRVYDVETGKLVRLIQNANSVRAIAFSPDGKYLASAHAAPSTYGDGSVTVWDATTWAERVSFTGHAGTVVGMSFSSDSRVLTTASEDKTVKVWDVPTTEK